MYQCFECEFYDHKQDFTNAISLARHFRDIHKQPEGTCMWCEEKCRDIHRLENHLEHSSPACRDITKWQCIDDDIRNIAGTLHPVAVQDKNDVDTADYIMVDYLKDKLESKPEVSESLPSLPSLPV